MKCVSHGPRNTAVRLYRLNMNVSGEAELNHAIFSKRGKTPGELAGKLGQLFVALMRRRFKIEEFGHGHEFITALAKFFDHAWQGGHGLAAVRALKRFKA